MRSAIVVLARHRVELSGVLRTWSSSRSSKRQHDAYRARSICNLLRYPGAAPGALAYGEGRLSRCATPGAAPMAAHLVERAAPAPAGAVSGVPFITYFVPLRYVMKSSGHRWPCTWPSSAAPACTWPSSWPGAAPALGRPIPVTSPLAASRVRAQQGKVTARVADCLARTTGPRVNGTGPPRCRTGRGAMSGHPRAPRAWRADFARRFVG